MAEKSRIKNMLEGREKSGGLVALMTPRMIISLVLIGIFSFAALITLSGYAGDLRQKNNGQAHALSRSAIGYGGLFRLLGDMDYDVRMARTENVNFQDRYALRIYTMSRPYQADQLDDLGIRTPTLIIMPKWSTVAHQEKKGWVQEGWNGSDVFDMHYHESDLKELAGDVTFTNVSTGDLSVSYRVSSPLGYGEAIEGIKIENLQTIEGFDLEPIFEVEEGAFLVKIYDTETYILSDPDFLNTMGISSRTRASLAVDLIDTIIMDSGADYERVDFDLTFHGFGGQTNVIKVLTQPPFLAATLCLLAAGLLIAWQAFTRFGDPRKVQRDYALGKFSLADNAARFIRIARREPNMAKDYTDLIRGQVIRELNLNGRRPQEIEAILKRREASLELNYNYADLQHRASATLDNLALMKLADDLANWRSNMILGEKK